MKIGYNFFSDTIALVLRCPNRQCDGSKFWKLLANPPVDYKDYQELKVQEKAGQCFGKVPRSVAVLLDEDLVETAKPGDDVIVIGQVVRRWKPLGRLRLVRHNFLLSSTLNPLHRSRPITSNSTFANPAVT